MNKEERLSFEQQLERTKCFADCNVGDIVCVIDTNEKADGQVGIATITEIDKDNKSNLKLSVDYNGEQFFFYNCNSFLFLLQCSVILRTEYDSEYNAKTIRVFCDSRYFNCWVSHKKEFYEGPYKFYNKATSISDMIERFVSMKPFEDVSDIPDVPYTKDKELYFKIIVPNIIRCGGIPKKDLKVGSTYVGNCRNSTQGVWNGTDFEIKRVKFGSLIDDTVEHFESDTETDVFVPIMEIKNQNTDNNADNKTND